MKKKINTLVILILVAALAAVGTLVKKNQETRSQASFANVDALFLPDSQTLNVGSSIVTTLMLNTNSHYLTGADLRVKYDQDKLSLVSVNVLNKDNSGKLSSWLNNSDDEVIVSKIDELMGTYTLIGVNAGKETSTLPNGLIYVVKMIFIAKANGSANVSLDTNYNNVVVGYNSAGPHQVFGIGKISGATYKIVGNFGIKITPTSTELKCGWCGANCVDSRKLEGMACSQIYMEGKSCVNQNGNCTIVSNVSPIPVAVRCGWCGSSCTDLNKVTGVCAQIYMTGKTCVNDNGNCVILSSVQENSSVSPTVVQ